MNHAKLLALAVSAAALAGCAPGGYDLLGAGASTDAATGRFLAPTAPTPVARVVVPAPAQTPQPFQVQTAAPLSMGPQILAPLVAAPQPVAMIAPAPRAPMPYASELVSVVPTTPAPRVVTAQPSPPPPPAMIQPAPMMQSAPAPQPLPAALQTVSAPPAAAPAAPRPEMDPALAAALRKKGLNPEDIVDVSYADGAPPPPPKAAPAPAASGGKAPMDPALAAALRKKGLNPEDVVGVDYSDGAAPVSVQAAAPARQAPVPASMASGGKPAMDPALAATLRKKGLNPDDVLDVSFSDGGAPPPPPGGARPVEAEQIDMASLTDSPAPRSKASAAAASSAPRGKPEKAPPAPAKAAGAAPAQKLAGGSWRLTALRGQAAAPGTELYFDASSGTAGGTGPCGQYAFEFQEGAGGAVTIKGATSLSKGCPRSAEEAAYLGALGAASAFRITPDGDLELTGGGATLARFTSL